MTAVCSVIVHTASLRSVAEQAPARARSFMKHNHGVRHTHRPTLCMLVSIKTRNTHAYGTVAIAPRPDAVWPTGIASCTTNQRSRDWLVCVVGVTPSNVLTTAMTTRVTHIVCHADTAQCMRVLYGSCADGYGCPIQLHQTPVSSHMWLLHNTSGTTHV